MPIFDIFSRRFGDTNVDWIDAVEGLGNAAERIKRLAAEKPPYFVFSAEKWMVIAQIDGSGSQDNSVQRGGEEQEQAS